MDQRPSQMLPQLLNNMVGVGIGYPAGPLQELKTDGDNTSQVYRHLMSTSWWRAIFWKLHGFIYVTHAVPPWGEWHHVPTSRWDTGRLHRGYCESWRVCTSESGWQTMCVTPCSCVTLLVALRIMIQTHKSLSLDKEHQSHNLSLCTSHSAASVLKGPLWSSLINQTTAWLQNLNAKDTVHSWWYDSNAQLLLASSMSWTSIVPSSSGTRLGWDARRTCSEIIFSASSHIFWVGVML